MAIRRSLIALVAAAGLLVAAAGTAFAAFYFVTLSTSTGPVGTEVSIRIEASNNLGGSDRSRVFLVRQNAFDQSQPCDDLPGAVVVGEVTWHEATVKFEDQSYPGFVAEGSFTVPEVPIGAYVLAANVIFVGSNCFRYDSFEVSAGVPDSAIATPRSPDVVAAILAFVTLALLPMLAGRARRASHP